MAQFGIYCCCICVTLTLRGFRLTESSAGANLPAAVYICSLMSTMLLRGSGRVTRLYLLRVSPFYWIPEAVWNHWVMSVCSLLLWKMIKVLRAGGGHEADIEPNINLYESSRQFTRGHQICPLCASKGELMKTGVSKVRETWCEVNYCDLKSTLNQLDISTRDVIKPTQESSSNIRFRCSWWLVSIPCWSVNPSHWWKQLQCMDDQFRYQSPHRIPALRHKHSPESHIVFPQFCCDMVPFGALTQLLYFKQF